MTINPSDPRSEDNPQKETPDGGIPQGGDGIGIAADSAPNTFEPEEDPDATEEPGG
jgi:hypothetical protein